MKIRSITYFCSPRYPLDQSALRRAADFLARGKAAFEAAGYEVQTVRLATVSFAKLLGEKRLNELPNLAHDLDVLIAQLGIGYASLGPALPEVPRSYEVIPEAIAATQNVFLAGIMASHRGGIDQDAVRANADVIVRCAPIDPGGFANLRFAALANVDAGSPFFPAAYHSGGGPTFALATEAADLAVDAFAEAKTIDEGRRALIASIEKHGRALAKVSRGLVNAHKSSGSRTTGPEFRGLDFSLAPFPTEASSLGAAFERLGVAKIGLHGSLAAAAILTECIDRARFPRVGFNGLLLPVLEDATLGDRAAQGTLTVKDLLLYAAVCGTGLDTVPLPGDTTADQLAAVLLDLSALALRLDKSLTARLMPIPGSKAGDPTSFDFGYFANTKVMALDAASLHGSLNARGAFALRRR